MKLTMEDTLRILNHNVLDVSYITNPQWEKAGRVHDWRNYIPNELKYIWHDLSEDARAIAYYMALQSADAEEWE